MIDKLKANFFKVSHDCTEADTFKQLSTPAKLLYYTLCKCSNKSKYNVPYFYVGDRLLSQLSGLSRPTITKAKAELRESYLIWMGNTSQGKRSKYQVFTPESGKTI